MTNDRSRKVEKTCIHCGKCTQSCAFLSRYGLDFGDREKLEELAWHCFLCGTCTEVCPAGIDGRERILEMRRERIRKNGGKLPEKGYGLLLWEKKDYRFRNEKGKTEGSVLFPGCNFPSFYPVTARYLARLLKEKAGIGTVYDCCGKPVAELGLEKEEKKIQNRLLEGFEKAGIREVIVLCPNCYHFLKEKLPGIRLVSIYRKLTELGLGQKIETAGEQDALFLPCPDRKSREILADTEPFWQEKPEVLPGIQCCGLGGCASVREPELAAGMLSPVKPETRVWTYCASCSGNFVRQGHRNTDHVLVQILGTGEKADTGHSLLNRIRSKYWKESYR